MNEGINLVIYYSQQMIVKTALAVLTATTNLTIISSTAITLAVLMIISEVLYRQF